MLSADHAEEEQATGWLHKSFCSIWEWVLYHVYVLHELKPYVVSAWLHYILFQLSATYTTRTKQFPTEAPSLTYQFCYVSHRRYIDLDCLKICMLLAHWKLETLSQHTVSKRMLTLVLFTDQKHYFEYIINMPCLTFRTLLQSIKISNQ